MAVKTTKTKPKKVKVAKKTPLELLDEEIKKGFYKGFKKTFASDKSCYWYSKIIKNPFLKNIDVCIEEAPRAKYLKVIVFCDGQGDDAQAGSLIIYENILTTELELMKLVHWLENKN